MYWYSFILQFFLHGILLAQIILFLKKKNNIDLTKFKNLFKIFKENVFF